VTEQLQPLTSEDEAEFRAAEEAMRFFREEKQALGLEDQESWRRRVRRRGAGTFPDTHFVVDGRHFALADAVIRLRHKDNRPVCLDFNKERLRLSVAIESNIVWLDIPVASGENADPFYFSLPYSHIKGIARAFKKYVFAIYLHTEPSTFEILSGSHFRGDYKCGRVSHKLEHAASAPEAKEVRPRDLARALSVACGFATDNPDDPQSRAIWVKPERVEAGGGLAICRVEPDAEFDCEFAIGRPQATSLIHALRCMGAARWSAYGDRHVITDGRVGCEFTSLSERRQDLTSIIEHASDQSVAVAQHWINDRVEFAAHLSQAYGPARDTIFGLMLSDRQISVHLQGDRAQLHCVVPAIGEGEDFGDLLAHEITGVPAVAGGDQDKASEKLPAPVAADATIKSPLKFISVSVASLAKSLMALSPLVLPRLTFEAILSPQGKNASVLRLDASADNLRCRIVIPAKAR